MSLSVVSNDDCPMIQSYASRTNLKRVYLPSFGINFDETVPNAASYVLFYYIIFFFFQIDFYAKSYAMQLLKCAPVTSCKYVQKHFTHHFLFNVQTKQCETFHTAKQTENNMSDACQTVEIIKWSKYYSQSKSDAYCFNHEFIVIFQRAVLLCLALSFNLIQFMLFFLKILVCVFFFCFNKRLQTYDNKQILMECFFFGIFIKTIESS